MKYRIAELLAGTDVGGAGTKNVDINIPDPITSLMIKFAVTVPATPTPTEHAAANIPKIEVVDGSDVLYSLTGLMAQAADFYDVLKNMMVTGSYVTSWELAAIFNINFGRWLWDEQLALDPTKFRNPQIKIEFDEDVAVAETSENDLSVIAHCFDEKSISPEGFLMTKTAREYTPVASATELTKLPRDYPIRRVYLQARVPDLWFGGIVSNVEFEEDNRKHVILDLAAEEMEQYLKSLWPRVYEHFAIDVDNTTGVDIYHMPTQGIIPHGAVYCASDVIAAVPFGYVNKYRCGDNIGVQAVGIDGHTPHGVLCFPMGKQDDLRDWWAAQEHECQMRVKAGASIGASETFRVATQQLRRY